MEFTLPKKNVISTIRFNLQGSRKFMPKNWVAVALMGLLFQAAVANAVGLGRLTVLSRLGQPFAAEIDLINVSKDDLSSLRVNLATPTAYQAANLRFDPVLNALRLTVERRDNGTPYIRATSARRMTEPYLDLLVELNSQDSKLQRGYAALLDLPTVTESATVTPAAAVAAPATAPVPEKELTPARAPRSSRPPRQPVVKDAPSAVVPAPAIPPPALKPVEPAKPEQAAPATQKSEPDAVEVRKAEAPEPPKAVASVPATATAPVPQKKIVPRPPVQPSILDKAMKHIVLISGIVLALLAAMGGWWAMRRRRPAPWEASESMASAVHAETPEDTTMGVAATATGATPHREIPLVATVSNVTDVVDPIDEAKVYLEHGQDESAKSLLKEALSKQPGRVDIQMLLLEILAGSGDKDGFNQLAGRLHKQTGGTGDHWKRAMATGYALDPAYPLYSPADDVATVGAPAGAPVPAGAAVPASARVDFDLSSEPASPAPEPLALINTADLLLQDVSASTGMDKAMVLVRASAEPAATSAQPFPAIDFEFPSATTPLADEVADKTIAPPTAKDDPGLDFKVDLSSIKPLPVDKPAPAKAVPTIADDLLWEEVQQKIDLARAYREMGDKEGALEMLREVERDGDAAHQAEAREILLSLE